MLDARCWMPDTGYWILDTGCWIPDAGYRMLDARCQMPDARCQMPDARCQIKKIINNKLQTTNKFIFKKFNEQIRNGYKALVRSRHECRFTTPFYVFATLLLCAFAPLLLCHFVTSCFSFVPTEIRIILHHSVPRNKSLGYLRFANSRFLRFLFSFFLLSFFLFPCHFVTLCLCHFVTLLLLVSL